jgi:methylenetetrahydrofolate reductase (NADPH)
VSPVNRLREALAARRFATTVEVVTPTRAQDLAEALGPALALARGLADDGRVAALSVTDRLRSDDDHDPVRAAHRLAEASGATPLVHLSGKDRTPESLARALGGLVEAGLDAVLCLSGDRLKAMPAGRRVPYVDSVQGVAIARRLVPGALVAAAVSPFKYTEEEVHNQYFKMARKHAAGADVLVTQVGWDMAKLEELARWRRERGLAHAVLANVMPLSAGAARHLRTGAVPGVVVSAELQALVEAEAAGPDRGRAARQRRLALQIVGAERLGFAGVQLSGLAAAADVVRVLDLVEAWRERAPSLEAWREAWEASLRGPDGRRARAATGRGFFVFDGTAGRAAAPGALARGRYLALHAVHQAIFHPHSPVYRALRPLARRVRPDSAAAAWLARAEHAVKAPLVGCELCGTCRLPQTLYVCPETCPKGLANGPCGGSTDNVCEAGDRACVHALVYRLARAAGRLHELERGIVPAAAGPRGTCSWIAHFAGERLPPPGGRP